MNTELTFGSITLGDKIASGGFGTVYRATMHPFGDTFAVKILDPHPFQSPDSRAQDRFVQEAKILMNLRHESIIPIYGVGEVGESESRPFILMEYFSGFDLQSARDTFGPPEPLAALGFVEAVARALDYAHAKDIVHRDLKPRNLMTLKGGHARVLDFGIAAIMDPDSVRFTQVGGTPVGDTYAPPELVDNPRLIDPRCDIYSLGACWFWLLTGTTPRGTSWQTALRAVPGMTPSYEAVVLRTLDQPESRYQSMAELARDVTHLRTGVQPVATLPEGLSDSDTILLGTAFSNEEPHDAPSLYQLEQELSGMLTKFEFRLSLRTLSEQSLVGFLEAESDFGQSFTKVCLTDEGARWITDNRDRVRNLMADVESQRKTRSQPGDNIPF